MLSSLGGVELLFPILEQVDSPLKQFTGQNQSKVTDGGWESNLSSLFNSKLNSLILDILSVL